MAGLTNRSSEWGWIKCFQDTAKALKSGQLGLKYKSKPRRRAYL